MGQQFEQAGSLQAIFNVFAYLTAAASWAALGVFVYYLRRVPNRGRYGFLFTWLLLSVTWWTINSAFRLFAGYSAPTVIMSLTKTIIELQAFFSVILFFYLQFRHRDG